VHRDASGASLRVSFISLSGCADRKARLLTRAYWHSRMYSENRLVVDQILAFIVIFEGV
jgi:hypothetical protein